MMISNTAGLVLARGAWWAICPECEGTRRFVIAAGHWQPCVYCKTAGRVPVALEGEL